MTFKVVFEREDDGRWIAEVEGLAGVLAYGTTQEEAFRSIQALTLRVIADRIEHHELKDQVSTFEFVRAA